MIVYRQATFGNPLRAEPARQPGRYHVRGETSPTQYLCLHPLGPFAEFMRGHSLRSAEQVAQVRERTWALRVEEDGLVEVTFENAGAFGLDAEALVDDDPARCQAFAAESRTRNVTGLIVPSAALPGTRNAVLFGARVGSPYQLPPLGSVDVPASITAVGGRPLLNLLDLVRFRGEPHTGLTAWRNGDELEFAEPDWELDLPAR